MILVFWPWHISFIINMLKVQKSDRERVDVIETSYPTWKAGIITTILYSLFVQKSDRELSDRVELSFQDYKSSVLPIELTKLIKR